MDFSSILSYVGYLYLASWIIMTLTHWIFGPIAGMFHIFGPNHKYPEEPLWFKVVKTITFSGIAIVFIGLGIMILWGMIIS